MRRFWHAAALGLALVALASGPASAQADDPARDDDQVVLHGSLVVPEGETVGTAVIFDGPATVAGTIRRSLIVFNGDVEVSGTVEGDAIVFNGDVVLTSGAIVEGNVVSRQAPTLEDGATVMGDQVRVVGRIDLGDVGIASRFAWWLGYSASTLALGLFLLLVAPGLDVAIARVARERLGAAAGIGALWFFLLPIAAVLLLVTVLGIPLGVFLLLGLALLYTVGYVAGAHGIGRFVMKPPSSRFAAFLIGWVIVRVIALIPVLGGFAWMVVAIFGLGLLAVAARRTPSPEAAVPVAQPPAPPMPV